MVSIPKVLTNKTVLTGLAQSNLKGASVFKPVTAKLDRMAPIVATLPAGGKLSKMHSFSADMSTKMSSIPSGLGKPFYVANHAVSFR